MSSDYEFLNINNLLVGFITWYSLRDSAFLISQPFN